MAKFEEELQRLVESSTCDQQALSDAQKHYHAVSAGLSSNTDGDDATLADQLMSKCAHTGLIIRTRASCNACCT